MPFGKLKVKARCKAARGSVNAEAVVEALTETWDDLSEAVNGLDQEEQDQLKDHFNKFIEDHDDLGEILFGDADDFVAAV